MAPGGQLTYIFTRTPLPPGRPTALSGCCTASSSLPRRAASLLGCLSAGLPNRLAGMPTRRLSASRVDNRPDGLQAFVQLRTLVACSRSARIRASPHLGWERSRHDSLDGHVAAASQHALPLFVVACACATASAFVLALAFIATVAATASMVVPHALRLLLLFFLVPHPLLTQVLLGDLLPADCSAECPHALVFFRPEKCQLWANSHVTSLRLSL